MTKILLNSLWLSVFFINVKNIDKLFHNKNDIKINISKLDNDLLNLV